MKQLPDIIKPSPAVRIKKEGKKKYKEKEEQSSRITRMMKASSTTEVSHTEPKYVF